MIQSELADFLESGVSVLLGSRDGDLVPECARAMGARVSADGTEVTVFLPGPGSDRTLENLRAYRRVAVCFARIDHHSVQIKGEVLSVEPADESDSARVRAYRDQLSKDWDIVGISPRTTRRVAIDSCASVRIRVESIFRQTPGPRAGDVLEPGESRP